MAPLEKADLLQGTLDLLILKVVALGPVHGYGISQRIRPDLIRRLQVKQETLYTAMHRAGEARMGGGGLGRVRQGTAGEVLPAFSEGGEATGCRRRHVEPAFAGCCLILETAR